MAGALSLRRRGYRVTLVDPGPLPHELAASSDISKVVRMEYGPDEPYMNLAEEALGRWLEWNARWPRPLYHETGVLMLCREPMSPGGFEHDSYELLRARGHRPERMNSAKLEARYPAWNASRYTDGFYHSAGGYAESAEVMAQLLLEAREAGVDLREGITYERWTESERAVTGIQCADGESMKADHVVLAGGAWTHRQHPDLREDLRPVGQPVFQLRPASPDLFRADRFPVFTADVARTGWYGFPLNEEGIVKVANHGPGRRIDPDAPREPTGEDVARLRDFLADTFPPLADAPIVKAYLCLYSDTMDGHFWIARDPEREGLTVASGGSGHAFKFAPVLGDLIADAVEGRENAYSHRFRWRPGLDPSAAADAARSAG